MADYGFLSALGAGLKGGLEGYMAAQKMDNEKRRLDILEKQQEQQTAWKEAQGLLAQMQAQGLEEQQQLKKIQMVHEIEKGGGRVPVQPYWIDPDTKKRTFTKPQKYITDEDMAFGDEDGPGLEEAAGYDWNFMAYEPSPIAGKANLDAPGSASPELIARAQQMGVLPTDMLPSRAKSFSHNQILGMIKSMSQKAPAPAKPIDEGKQFDLEQKKMLADPNSDISKSLYQEALAFSKKYGTPTPPPNRTGNEYKGYLDRYKGGYAKPPGSAKAPKITAEQYKAAGFTQQMEEADKILNSYGTEAGSLKKAAGRAIPGFLGALKSQDVKKIEAAERQFVMGVLRRESGAAINAGELESYASMYFPRAGDNIDVIQQKAEARAKKIAAFRSEAGPAYGMAQNMYVPPKGLLNKKPKGPAIGTTKSYKGKTYKFKGGDPNKKENWVAQ